MGVALALLTSHRSRPVRWPAIGLVEIGRGTPALVMLQSVYYGLPSAGLTLSSFIAAAIYVLLSAPLAWLSRGLDARLRARVAR